MREMGISPTWTQQLASKLARRAPATLSDEGAQRAAVAVVIAGTDDPAILFVKRRERAGDPWSGHVAMPGGFASPTDQSAARTAARETLEETGLDLGGAEPLGALDDVYPRTSHLPKVIVTPVVFAVAGRHPVSPSDEAERAAWVSVADLLKDGNRGSISLVRGGVTVNFPSINVDGLSIWGLTERVLSQLFSL